MSINPDFLCPITSEIMLDPVMTIEGHNYERKNIEEWFKTCDEARLPLKDPKTGVILSSRRLVTNHQLRNLITSTLDPVLLTTRLQQDQINGDNIQRLPRINTGWSSNGLKRLLLIAVIDISGSMACQAIECKSREGSEFSRLDLVKHSLNTAINLLSEHDAVILITFSSEAKILKDITCTSVDEIPLITDSVNKMIPTNNTNLFAGIKMGLETANLHHSKFEKVRIVVLTDGEPTSNYNPPRGLHETVHQIYEEINRDNITVSTIAYGYGPQLDSELLFNISKDCKGIYTYVPDGGEVATVFIHLVANMIYSYTNSLSVEDLALNTLFVKTLEEAIYKARLNKFTEAQTVMTNFKNHNLKKNSNYLKALITDIEHPDKNKGQILKGLSNTEDYFWSKWGQHYLPAILSAHSKKQCISLKDVSMQFYVDQKLKEIVDQGLIIFGLIKAPEPSCITHEQRSNVNYIPTQMATLSSTADCFSSSTLIKLSTGLYKRASEIKKGDKLYPNSNVVYVIKEPRKHKFLKITDDVFVTPWHPISIDNGPWTVPNKDLIETSENVAYNFLLNEDSDHIIHLSKINSNNIRALTLGHGINDNPVTSHAFFADYKKVIENLKKFPETNGLIIVNGAKRSVVNGRVLEFC